MELKYLNRNGAYVKKFVVRAENYDNVEAATVLIKDNLHKLAGNMMYQQKISEVSEFFIISFEDRINLSAWESIITSSIKDAKIVDIMCSKVLLISDEKTDVILQKSEEVKATIREYDVAVLKEKKIANNTYELLLFFTDEEKMHQWEEAFHVQV